MNASDAKTDNMDDARAQGSDPDDTWAADGMGDDDVQDPEFAAILAHVEAFAVKAITRISHAPAASPDQDVQAETSAESAETSAHEPGTDAYDEFYGIPGYEIE